MSEDIKKVESEYRLKKPIYLHLRDVLKRDIKEFLKKEKLEVIEVQGRIKKFKSLQEKIERKNYPNPLENVTDICGIRIICYYQTDLKVVEKIIETEFDVLEKTDKVSLLEEDQFGYNSIHYIVKIKDEYLAAPDYRNLNDVQAEIQVRTILAHAWAEIEHSLAYKTEGDIPQQFKRKISRISALLEIADNEFDSLRKEKEDYQSDLTNKQGIIASDFPFNLDGFQAFLNKYFPDRQSNVNLTRNLLNELQVLEMSYDDIVRGMDSIGDNLSEIEREVFEKFDTDPVMSQTGIVKLILDLTSEKYQTHRENIIKSVEIKEFLKDWRKKVNKENG